ncbi:OLC1v1033536C1 [Oldenlandia corymbosa var. corymbosa]|uniref:OLC1v1033536C1 n=1 Tax=Oldenlandia corymbosa var. corymbosa TaxID=529605 RepID=A0AAV1CRE2_OLDCO|nr:OLC1v1033536C1 [Oldenlandia corymbosa var. corymbosa]
MGVVSIFCETLLVPLSVLVTLGYHAYLCHSLRRHPGVTTIGFNCIKRRSWLHQLNQGDDKQGMLAVQSLRNTLMGSILTGTVTIIITLCLGALINNTFNVFHHFRRMILFSVVTDTSAPTGLESKIIAIKYGSAYIFLVTSFLSSSLGISYLVDANFLINAVGGELDAEYTRTVLERGFTLVAVANRVLCLTLPLLLWMFGSVPMFISSLALVWLLYQLDFPPAQLHYTSSHLSTSTT